MDGNRRGGWRVCVDTADFIKISVAEELREFGHLSRGLVELLRREAKEDHGYHAAMGFIQGSRVGAIKLKNKKGF